MFYSIVRFIAYLICKILFFLRIEGMENVPKEGGAVICPNHRSFWDAVIVLGSIHRPMAYLAKEELFKNKLFGFVLRKMNCYPVKRDGRDLSVVKTAVSLLKKGEVLVIFPEGERIRKGKTPKPKSGAFRLAIMGGVPLIPVGIGGDFRLFHNMHIRGGAPIDTSAYKGQRLTEEEYQKNIQDIMQTVYRLAGTEQMHV